MLAKNKRLLIVVLVAVVLLFIPYVAMQFTNEVNWTWFDFVAMGTLLLITCFLCEVVIRKTRKTKYAIAIGLIIFSAFFLIWAELAVGVLGTPFAGE